MTKTKYTVFYRRFNLTYGIFGEIKAKKFRAEARAKKFMKKINESRHYCCIGYFDGSKLIKN